MTCLVFLFLHAEVVKNAANGGCAILPVSVEFPLFYGVFSTVFIKKGHHIFDNGRYEVPHTEMCESIGVEPEDFKTRQLGNSIIRRKKRFTASSGGRTFKPPRNPRHIYTFLNDHRNMNKKDIGSKANDCIKWVDLAKNRSPTLFLNSISEGDTRPMNVEFVVEGDGNDEVSIVVAKTDIPPFTELLCDYYMP